ncbi:MAG: DUF3850 domain-containing protein [Bacteroidetes bacterium]|nr:DUF3850 domain-containing protein [Bacteroidota bacterium]
MKVHTLKTWSEYFTDILNGTKTFEVRKNDRDFKIGDILQLEEWNQETGSFTSRHCSREVVYVLDGGQFGVEKGYVVMGLKEVS